MISRPYPLPREITSRPGNAARQGSRSAVYKFTYAGLELLSEKLEAGYHLRLGGRVITKLDEFLLYAESEE